MAAPEPRLADVEYVEVQCKSALNPVKNMGFAWSLNPYTGCEHRCAFCYVRAFELRADRPPTIATDGRSGSKPTSRPSCGASCRVAPGAKRRWSSARRQIPTNQP